MIIILLEDYIYSPFFFLNNKFINGFFIFNNKTINLSSRYIKLESSSIFITSMIYIFFDFFIFLFFFHIQFYLSHYSTSVDYYIILRHFRKLILKTLSQVNHIILYLQSQNIYNFFYVCYSVNIGNNGEYVIWRIVYY